MKRSDLRRVSSLMSPYLKGGAVGAVIGAIIGTVGEMRDMRESGRSLGGAQFFSNAMFGAIAGCIAGVLFRSLHRLRERGEVYYYYSWALSVGIAAGIVFLPGAVRERDWRPFIVAICGGVFGRFGLAAYARMMFGNKE